MILPYDSRGFETGPGGGAERAPDIANSPSTSGSALPAPSFPEPGALWRFGPRQLIGLSAAMNPTTSISQWGSAIFGDLRSDLRYPLFLGMHCGNRLQRLSPQQTFQNVAVHADLRRACRTSPG
jgi:hypothetical protein